MNAVGSVCLTLPQTPQSRHHAAPRYLSRGANNRSFNPNPSRLDNWPPFLDFGFLKSAQCLGRPLLAGRQVLRDGDKSLADCRITHRIHDCAIEFDNYVFWGALWSPDSLP